MLETFKATLFFRTVLSLPVSALFVDFPSISFQRPHLVQPAADPEPKEVGNPALHSEKSMNLHNTPDQPSPV